MSIGIKEVLFFLILFGSNLIQAITGFAGTLLAMPPSMELLGVDEAKTVLAILDQLSCLLIVLTGFKYINWKEFIKMMIFMLIGMAIGISIFNIFPTNQSLTLYGIMILTIALYKLFGHKFFKTKEANSNKVSPLKNYLMILVILAAGVIHGMFVSGGALLVIYASMALKDKEEFRATMAMLWVTIGFYITFNQIQAGFFNSQIIFLIIIGLIPLFLGIYVGTKLVKRINQETFLKLTYILLIISGTLAIL